MHWVDAAFVGRFLYLKRGWLWKFPKHAGGLEGEIEKWCEWSGLAYLCELIAQCLPLHCTSQHCSFSDVTGVLYYSQCLWRLGLSLKLGLGKTLARAGQSSFLLFSCQPAQEVFPQLHGSM